MDHFHHTIQGWFNCEPFYRRMIEEAQDGAKFVEVGVWKGKSAAFMAVEIINSGKQIDLFLVDHFKGSVEHQSAQEVKEDTLEAVCRANLESVSHLVKFIPMTSVAAASTFQDGSLDMVYIDGSHEYQDVKDDIEAWLPKVKIGGILAGDDYGIGNHAGVKQAVDELLPLAEKDRAIWSFKRV